MDNEYSSFYLLLKLLYHIMFILITCMENCYLSKITFLEASADEVKSGYVSD